MRLSSASLKLRILCKPIHGELIEIHGTPEILLLAVDANKDFVHVPNIAETTLLAAGFPRVYLFRPAEIYPVETRREPNLSYRVLRAVYPAFRLLFPNQVMPADELGRAMVDVAVRGTVKEETRVFENRDIRAMVESG